MDLFKDFHTVKDLKFDIKKLQVALKQVLSRKDFDDAAGTKYIASIALNQIPGDPNSTQGESAKGIYWTKPDHTGKELLRDKMVDESAYTEFVKVFENTYFKEVYENLSKKYRRELFEKFLNELFLNKRSI